MVSRAIARSTAIIIVAVVVAAIAGVVVVWKTYKPPEVTVPTGGAQQPQQPTTSAPSQPKQNQTAAQPSTKPSAGQGVILTIISRHPTDILLAARKAFLQSDLAKKYHVVDIKTVVIPPGLWEEYIRRGQADVAWGGGPTLFDRLYQEGLLAPLTLKEALDAAAQIPDTVAGMPMKRVGKDGKLYWVAAAIASFGFTVNHDRLKDYGLPVPKRWIDLASPTIGKPLVELGEPALGIADPTASTSNTRMYEIILQRYGWDEGWKVLTLMAANAEIYSASGEVRDAVIRGDIAVGITIDFYGYTAHLVNPACEYIIPAGETIVNGDPIAFVKGSKHPEAAQAFIAWVLTDGQKIWLNPSINRIPANPNVFNTPEGKKREDLKAAYEKAVKSKNMPFNDTLALEYEQVMRWYFKATLIEVNDYLKAAWKAILSKYFAGKITDDQLKQLEKQLGEPITFKDPLTGKTVKFTQDYAIKIQDKFLKDPTFRESLIAAWKKAALEKYQQVLKEVSG